MGRGLAAAQANKLLRKKSTDILKKGFRFQGFKVSGFRVSGFKVSGFRVSGFQVSCFRLALRLAFCTDWLLDSFMLCYRASALRSTFHIATK